MYKLQQINHLDTSFSSCQLVFLRKHQTWKLYKFLSAFDRYLNYLNRTSSYEEVMSKLQKHVIMFRKQLVQLESIANLNLVNINADHYNTDLKWLSILVKRGLSSWTEHGDRSWYDLCCWHNFMMWHKQERI